MTLVLIGGLTFKNRGLYVIIYKMSSHSFHGTNTISLYSHYLSTLP